MRSILKNTTPAEFDDNSGSLKILHNREWMTLGRFPDLGWRHDAWRLRASRRLRGLPSIPPPCLSSLTGDSTSHVDRHGQLELGICLSDSELMQRNSLDAWHQWYAQVPHEIRECIAIFPASHMRLLGLFAIDPRAATDLAHANPALLYMLAHPVSFGIGNRFRARASVRFQLGKRQRRLLQMLGFPGTEAMRNVSAKIVPRTFRVQWLLTLRNLLRTMNAEEHLHDLSHLPRINTGVLALLQLRRQRVHAAPSLLLEVARDHAQDRHARTAAELRRIAAAWKRLDPNPASTLTITSHEQMLRVDRNVDVELNKLKLYNFTHAVFPAPPYAGNEHIRPICSVDALREEARAMSHCVAGYSEQIVRGGVYVYSVLAPERATVSIVQMRHSHSWRLSELRLSHNRVPSIQTVELVREWAKARGISDAVRTWS